MDIPLPSGSENLIRIIMILVNYRYNDNAYGQDEMEVIKLIINPDSSWCYESSFKTGLCLLGHMIATFVYSSLYQKT